MTHPPRYLCVPGTPSLSDRLHRVGGIDGKEYVFLEGNAAGGGGGCWPVAQERGTQDRKVSHNYWKRLYFYFWILRNDEAIK